MSQQSTPSKFEILQGAIRTYGEAAFENLVRCKGFAQAILNAFPEYIGCEKSCVKAVPPSGKFDPRRVYGDKAFSYAHRQVIALEPISFGLALTIKNIEDSGSLWLRTAIAVEITGETYDVYVAQQPVIHVPLDYKEELNPALEAIYQEFLQTFRVQVMAFNDERFETGIGFIP